MLLRTWVVWIVLMVLPIWANAAIVDKVVLNNVVYLLDDTNKKIHRFDASTGSFLTAITVTGTDAATSFDTINGTDFYVGVGRDIRKFSVASDGSVSGSIVRRVAGTINDLDVNGNFVVLSFGDKASEVWSIRLSDGALVSRSPVFPASVEDPKFHLIKQLSYVASAGKYFLRLNANASIYVNFNATTGVLSDYDTQSFLEDENALKAADKLFFVPELALAIDEKAIAYAVNGTVFKSLYYRTAKEPFWFFGGGEGITTDGTVDAVATDGTDFYVALTITNSCNLRVGGTQVSVNGYSGATSGGRTFKHVVDFTQVLSDIAVINGTLYGFYFATSDATDLSMVSAPSGTEDKSWVDTTFVPATEYFDVSNDKVKALGTGSDKVIINIDEGCKHYLVEYDATNKSYSRQVEVYQRLKTFATDAVNNNLYWAVNWDNDYFTLEYNNGTSSEFGSWGYGEVGAMVFMETGVLVQHTNADKKQIATVFDTQFNVVKKTKDDEATEMVIGAWTSAVWDEENNKVIFVSSDKLYQWDVTAWLAGTSGVKAVESLHFAALTTTTVNSPMVLSNVKETSTSAAKDLFYTAGNFFDLGSDGLLIDDAARADYELATWTGSALYTADLGTNTDIERWTFSLSEAKSLELVGVSDQLGKNLALVTVTINGTQTPLLMTRLDDDLTLNIVTDLDASAEVVENNTPPDEEEEAEAAANGTTTSGSGTPSNGLNCSALGCLGSTGGGMGLGVLIGLLSLLLVRRADAWR